MSYYMNSVITYS